ncbi:MAG: energy transducer TonB [Saprospiraceae bacterium]
MRSEKGRRKKRGIYFFSISVHAVLMCLIAFPFLINEQQQEEELFQGLLVQFNDNKTQLVSRVSKAKTSKNPGKKAAETKFLKPKLEKSRDKRVIKKAPKKASVNKIQAEKKALNTKSRDETHTLTEKRRDFLVKNIRNAELEKRKSFEDQIQKANLEKKAKKAKYEKMKNAFSHLLKNANNETSNHHSDLELFDQNMVTSNERSKTGTSENIANRKVIFIPQINDDSQKEGRVVINICVDPTGKVLSAKYTQRGSTTTDNYLVKLALKNAKRYRFSPNHVPKQCGRVNIDFVVR